MVKVSTQGGSESKAIQQKIENLAEQQDEMLKSLSHVYDLLVSDPKATQAVCKYFSICKQEKHCKTHHQLSPQTAKQEKFQPDSE